MPKAPRPFRCSYLGWTLEAAGGAYVACVPGGLAAFGAKTLRAAMAEVERRGDGRLLGGQLVAGVVGRQA